MFWRRDLYNLCFVLLVEAFFVGFLISQVCSLKRVFLGSGFLGVF